MTREEKEELAALMALEKESLSESPILLTDGSGPGLFKPKTTWNGIEIEGFLHPIFPKPEFTDKDLKEWGGSPEEEE